MQWPYFITAEQWAAFGAFWGGMAQFGLVVVGVLAGREWLRQERYRGVREIFETHQTGTNRILNMLKQLYIPRDDHGVYLMFGNHLNVLNEFDGILRELHFCAIRMYLYDDDLCDAMQQANITLEEYRRKYIKYHDLAQQLAVNWSSNAGSVPDVNELNVLEKEIFQVDTNLWFSFVYSQEFLLGVVKKKLWIR